jgi:hypothetical protein
LRETTTSYTSSCLVESERHESLRDAIIRLCIELRPLDGPPAVIRTDPAPGFVHLINDKLLKHYRMTVEIGRIKNLNKNPVAEKAVRELEDELLRQDPTGGPASPLLLSVATTTLNARIRSRGLSAREMWFQRDQFTNEQVPFNDSQMIQAQHSLRTANHPHSARSKAPLAPDAPTAVLEVGDLVYLYSDRNKSHARNRYLVTSVEDSWCNIRKFVGSQLRNASYRVKRSELVPSYQEHRTVPLHSQSLAADDSEFVHACPDPPPQPPDPPCIPPALSTPATMSVPSVASSSQPMPIPPFPQPSESIETVIPQPYEVDSETVTPLLTQRRSSRQHKLPEHLKDFILD